jgi:hypothetical protein
MSSKEMLLTFHQQERLLYTVMADTIAQVQQIYFSYYFGWSVFFFFNPE